MLHPPYRSLSVRSKSMQAVTPNNVFLNFANILANGYLASLHFVHYSLEFCSMFLTQDGSAIRDDGTAIIFSIERFIRDIVEGDCCFICGKRRDEVAFNDEHIIPDWVLRRTGLYNKQITLPNGTLYRYREYKVPCCVPCNSLMGRTFEEPISELFEQGYEAVAAHMRTRQGIAQLFIWLAFIYLKTHLKDLSLRMHRDRRMPEGQIADIYDWENLHHVHCLARSYLAQVAIDPQVIGSVLLLPAKSGVNGELFDYADNYPARTLLVRIGNIALFAVLNDARAVLQFRTDPEQAQLGYPLLTAIRHALSPLQARELMAELTYINLRIEDRPVFRTVVDPTTEEATIVAETPEGYHLRAGNREFYGELLYYFCGDRIDSIAEPDRTEIANRVRAGRSSFLWSADGAQADWDI
jgi:hypothetical protein